MRNGIGKDGKFGWYQQCAKRQNGDGGTGCLRYGRIAGWNRHAGSCGEAFLHVGHEPEAASVNGPNDRLRRAIIAQGLPGRSDAAGDARVRYGSPLPDRVGNFVFGDHPVAVSDQMHQQRKHLRFQPDGLAAPDKFKPFLIKAKVAENPCHATE